MYLLKLIELYTLEVEFLLDVNYTSICPLFKKRKDFIEFHTYFMIKSLSKLHE